MSGRSTSDVTMPDDTHAPPKEFVASSLSDSDLRTLNELSASVRRNSFDFESHVAFINLLHKGFVEHVNSGQDGSSYELLEDLRQAREAMDRIFPVGEDLWIDWLTDECDLAETMEQRISVVQLFERAVQDEPNSVSLWKLYGDYWYQLFVVSHDSSNEMSGTWSNEDKAIGKEAFTWDSVRKKWNLAYQNTGWRLNDSNIIFDRYMEILLADESKYSTPHKVEEISNMFNERLLKEPHATWDQTAQAYSSFITNHYSAAAYEQVMTELTRLSTQVKNMYRQREIYEDRIEQAKRNGDIDGEWNAYSKYLEWEVTGKGPFSFPIINSLYQRATTRFATYPSLWTDYVEFLMQNPNKDVPLRYVLERATRHCPWSGDLWAHRILTLEAEGESFKAIEEVKHRATANGMLDTYDLEELIKVSLAWCGCLRRRAFDPGATDDEIDIAEMGIRSALEHIRKIGERQHGNDYRGDPQYRLERIHIKFLTQRGELDMARDVWRNLVPAHANLYDFWYRYYIWEMVTWAKFAIRANNEPVHQFRTPSDATAVLSLALQYHATMDWPEQLVRMYLNHCEEHESIQQLRTAIIDARQISALIAKRREKENAERTAYYEQQQQDAASQAAYVQAESSGKRKRESEEVVTDHPPKKAKPKAVRDREHTLVIAKNFPLDATEVDVKKFFRDCGTIVDIKFTKEDDAQIAAVEFKTQEDALTAQTRTLKKYKGQTIEVDFGTGTTLWVTNYPPTADEKYIRDIFKDVSIILQSAGRQAENTDPYQHDIVEVRFPTLLKNARRRFCYVQFATSADAIKASELDGTELEDEDGKKYVLQTKLSDPNKKDHRHGPLYEGREVFIKNLHWNATEADVKAYLEEAGTVESVRIPRLMNGKSKGFAFVVFENTSGAQSAVEKFHDGSIKGRRFSIEISQPQERRTTTTIRHESVASGSAGSPAPSSAAAAMSPEVEDTKTNGTQVTEESKKDQETQQPIKDTRERERTMALMNVPDTISAARIEKLLEPYGAIKKLTVRADHAGAIVEFAEESSVGKASLGLDGIEFEGSVIRAGKVSDLLKQKPFQRELRMDQKKREAPKKATNANPFANAMIRRPGEQRRGAGRGRGGRGGLGAQSRGLARREATAASSGSDGVAKAGMKTNADFRAMLLGGKIVAHDGDSKEEEANETKRTEEPKEKPMDDLMDDLMGGSDDEEDLEEANGDTEDDDEMED